VHYSKEAVVVEKQGRPFAVLISPEDYERFLAERQARFAVLDEIRQDNTACEPGEVEEDVAAALAQLRRERRLAGNAESHT
jgi:PHD/YefM family antitoxin component YafN of YafNO toxin-antitoxin module